jgi:hypothetical protein
MGTFSNALKRVVSSDVLTPADCQVGDILTNPSTGNATLIAQNATTGAPTAVSLAGGAPAAPSSLETSVLKASAAVNAYRFLSVSGSNLAKQAAPQGSAAVAVSKAAAAPGANIDAVLMGVAVVESGALVNAGDKITTDAVGRAVSALPLLVDGAGPQMIGSQVLGVALSSALGAGTPITILFTGAFGVYPNSYA